MFHISSVQLLPAGLVIVRRHTATNQTFATHYEYAALSSASVKRLSRALQCHFRPAVVVAGTRGAPWVRP